MPCLKILTNLPKNRIPSDFSSKVIPVLSKVVKKEESKFLVLVSPDNYFGAGGDSNSPGAVATLESIGNLGLTENKVIIKAVSDVVESELGIPPNRFFLTFYDVKPQDAGIGGVTRG